MIVSAVLMSIPLDPDYVLNHPYLLTTMPQIEEPFAILPLLPLCQAVVRDVGIAFSMPPSAKV